MASFKLSLNLAFRSDFQVTEGYGGRSETESRGKDQTNPESGLFRGTVDSVCSARKG